MAKPTLRKIAAELGLSVGTVSKALKDYPDISENTKLKVKALVKKLNYKPNAYAQILRSKESRIVGLIVPEIVHHFFSNVIHGVVKAAESSGYLVITLQSNEKYEVEKQQIELLVNKKVDGILISLADNTIDHKHINGIIKSGVPVVLFDKISKLVNCHKIVIDDEKAAFEATEHLIKKGCKKIAHVRGLLKPQTTIDRLKGYKRALKHYNIEYDRNLVFEAKNLSFEDGKTIADNIFHNHKEIDGVFALTDLIAIGVLERFKELGLSIPKDIAIIGFSNWFLSKITTPRLSTVNQSGYDIGSAAFNLLLEEIQDVKNNRVTTYRTEKFPSEIIERGSTNKLLK